MSNIFAQAHRERFRFYKGPNKLHTDPETHRRRAKNKEMTDLLKLWIGTSALLGLVDTKLLVVPSIILFIILIGSIKEGLR